MARRRRRASPAPLEEVAARRSRWCAASTRRASPAATCRRACCASSTRAASRRDAAAPAAWSREHWDPFLRRQFPAIAKTLGVELRRARAGGRADPQPSRPTPAASSRTDRAHYIEPDVVVRQGRRRVRHPAQRRRPAAAAVSRAYRRMLQKMRAEGAPGRGAAVHQGQDALGGLADQEPRPAPAHDLQGRRLDRPPAARVPRPGHRAPAADGAARRRRGHRHARVDGQPRGLEQVHAHPARPVPDEVLLPQRHRPRVRRGHLVADGQAQDPAADPGRGPQAPALRQRADADPEPRGHPDRPPHGRQVPRRAEHPSSTDRKQIF